MFIISFLNFSHKTSSTESPHLHHSSLHLGLKLQLLCHVSIAIFLAIKWFSNAQLCYVTLLPCRIYSLLNHNSREIYSLLKLRDLAGKFWRPSRTPNSNLEAPVDSLWSVDQNRLFEHAKRTSDGWENRFFSKGSFFRNSSAFGSLGEPHRAH